MCKYQHEQLIEENVAYYSTPDAIQLTQAKLLEMPTWKEPDSDAMWMDLHNLDDMKTLILGCSTFESSYFFAIKTDDIQFHLASRLLVLCTECHDTHHITYDPCIIHDTKSSVIMQKNSKAH